MAQQLIWAQKDSNTHSVSLFVNFVQTDPNIATIAQIAELGLFWKGPLPARPHDEIGVAVGRDRVSTTVSEILYDEKITPLQDLQPEPVRHAGYPTEIYYSVNTRAAITLRPNVQFIHTPGGVADRASVLVFGLHSSIEF
jgi:porin